MQYYQYDITDYSWKKSGKREAFRRISLFLVDLSITLLLLDSTYLSLLSHDPLLVSYHHGLCFRRTVDKDMVLPLSGQKSCDQSLP